MELYGFDADQVARIAAAVRAYEGTAGAAAGRRNRGPDQNYSRVWFKNSYSGTIPKYGVMRVTGTTAVDNFYFLNCDQPDSTYRWLYLVNGFEDVPQNGYGWGTWLWHGGQVLYNGATPAVGERWGPVASQWYLQQHRPGFWVFGGNDTNLTATVAVQIPPGEVRVKNDTGSAVAAGSTGTFGIYGGSAGTTDTGLEVALTNGSSVSWADTKYGWATADAGGLIFGAPHQT